MMRRRSFTLPRPSSRPSSKASGTFSRGGFTLVELLVALTVGVVLVGLAVQVAVADRRVMDADARRVATNQTVRTALDLVATDLRQAGEDMNVQLSPIIVTNGTGGASDRLAVRRQLTDQTLPVCADVSSGVTNIQVSAPLPGATAECTYTGTTASPVPSNLAAWEALRLASPTGTLRAFLYDRSNKVGEYVTFSGIAGTASTQQYYLKRLPGTLARTYSASSKPFLVLLEEREYFVQSRQLMMRLNADAATDQPISPDITDFSVTVDVDTGTASAPAVVTRTGFTVGDDWKRIVKLDLGVSGAVTENGRTTARALTTSVFPRNVLSK